MCTNQGTYSIVMHLHYVSHIRIISTLTPDTPSSRAAHNPPGSIITPSTMSATTISSYWVERRPNALKDIQAVGKREDVRRTVQATRIHCEQVRRGHEGEL